MCQGRIQNLIIGNLQLKPGEIQVIQPGIGLLANHKEYNHDSLTDLQLYALAYNKDGLIVDHNPEIGKILIQREAKTESLSDNYRYQIRLLAHNSNHALATFSLDLKKAHIDFERKEILNGHSVGVKIK